MLERSQPRYPRETPYTGRPNKVQYFCVTAPNGNILEFEVRGAVALLPLYFLFLLFLFFLSMPTFVSSSVNKEKENRLETTFYLAILLHLTLHISYIHIYIYIPLYFTIRLFRFIIKERRWQRQRDAKC